ncbi:MAG: hypothetical protein ACM32E_26555 [Gemmatimonadota bacterium]
MKSGTRVAVAVGAGYLLGRRRKMRMAMMLSGAAMAGGLGGGIPGQLLRRGTKLLGSADVLGKVSPELGEVTGLIGGELLPVGKAAAKAAVSSRINALSDRVHERAEALRNPADEDGREDEDEEPAGRARRARRAGDEATDEEAPDEEAPDEEAADEEVTDEADEEYEPAPRATRSRRGGTGTARRGSGNGQRRDRGGEGEDDEDQPVRATGRAVRAAGSRAGAPVRRTRR